jgi:hypothetical protein
MNKLLLAGVVFLPYSIATYSAESQSVSFKEYEGKVANLSSQCASKNMPSFSGFCLSQKYENQTALSIGVALQLISYDIFYKKCEHAEFPDKSELLQQSLNIEDTKKFHAEMKPQKEAIENYTSYFDSCKSKEKNDLTVKKKLEWFEYTVNSVSNSVKDKDSGLYLVRDTTGKTINVVEALEVLYSSSPETNPRPSIKTNTIEKTNVILDNDIYQSPFNGLQLKILDIAGSSQIRVIQSVISRRPDGSPVTSDVVFFPNDSYGGRALIVTRLRDDKPKDTESILSSFIPSNEIALERDKRLGVTYKKINTLYGATIQRTIKNRRVNEYFPYQVTINNREKISTVGVSRFCVVGDFLLEFIVIADSRYVVDISKLESVAESESDLFMNSLIKLPQLP